MSEVKTITTDLEVVPRQVPFEEPKNQVVRMQDISSLWETYVRMRGKLAVTTKANYDQMGRRFCNFAANRPIGPTLLKDWMEYIQGIQVRRKSGPQPISAIKINWVNVRIKAFLLWLHKFGYLSQDYRSCLPRLLEPEQKASEIFTEEEYQVIKKYCTGRPWCQPQLWLIILAYRTGMSLIDCCFLRWRDVHLNHNSPSFIDIYRIKVERHGQKALCQIPIIPNTDVHNWLMFLKEREKDNYKRFDGITDFVHQDCPGLYQCTLQTLRQDFKNIFSRAGVKPGRTFRHFRNSFISNLVNSDVQLALVMKMTGHQNTATLMRYLKADRRSLQDGLARAFAYSAMQAGVGKDASGVGSDDVIKIYDDLELNEPADPNES